jgi:hypothetical protein
LRENGSPAISVQVWSLKNGPKHETVEMFYC